MEMISFPDYALVYPSTQKCLEYNSYPFWKKEYKKRIWWRKWKGKELEVCQHHETPLCINPYIVSCKKQRIV